MEALIDEDGFRHNIALVLTHASARVLWAKRRGMDAWQFPQGGIHPGESLHDAVYRELWEEVGLESRHVSILGQTRHWLRYRLPNRSKVRNPEQRCIGQKQIWFLLSLTGDENDIHLARHDEPEFDAWQWVNYWYPVNHVIEFKRNVYRRALHQLRPIFFEHLSITDETQPTMVSSQGAPLC